MLTNDYIEVMFQSTLMKMPCTFVPQFSGSASVILDVEWVREEEVDVVVGSLISSLQERI